MAELIAGAWAATMGTAGAPARYMKQLAASHPKTKYLEKVFGQHPKAFLLFEDLPLRAQAAIVQSELPLFQVLAFARGLKKILPDWKVSKLVLMKAGVSI